MKKKRKSDKWRRRRWLRTCQRKMKPSVTWSGTRHTQIRSLTLADGATFRWFLRTATGTSTTRWQWCDAKCLSLAWTASAVKHFIFSRGEQLVSYWDVTSTNVGASRSNYGPSWMKWPISFAARFVRRLKKWSRSPVNPVVKTDDFSQLQLTTFKKRMMIRRLKLTMTCSVLHQISLLRYVQQWWPCWCNELLCEF